MVGGGNKLVRQVGIDTEKAGEEPRILKPEQDAAESATRNTKGVCKVKGSLWRNMAAACLDKRYHLLVL